MTRILVVDDDADIRQLLVYALSSEGYEVAEAPDGQSAMDLIAHEPPDIIILDMKMPGMDGWEFARLYRQRHNHQASIIVLTAAPDAARRALAVNAESFLSKPFDLDTLVERVAAIAQS
jgi:DNA-binding response OmpR family regulator